MPTVQELYELWADESELREALQRSLEPRGVDSLFETFAGLGPKKGELVATMAIASFDAETIESAAAEAGLVQRSVDRLGSEWRERMLEDGTWKAADDLLELARLRRAGLEGPQAEAARGGALWGIYQMLGKLCPTVYVWTFSD